MYYDSCFEFEGVFGSVIVKHIKPEIETEMWEDFLAHSERYNIDGYGKVANTAIFNLYVKIGKTVAFSDIENME